MNFFDDYFVFSSSEKKGIFIFLCVLSLMTAFYMVMPYVFTAKKYDFTEFKNELESKRNSQDKESNSVELFSFNPNTISRDSLVLLGLSSKQSYNVVNYRAKVGKFNSEKDFRKIYSIPDSLADELSPFLVFDEIETKRFSKEKSKLIKYKKDSLFPFNPNEANLEELKVLGLTDKQAQTIMNYKSKGGKFYKKEDLKKMYSISDELYNKLEPYILINEKEKIIEEKQIIAIELNSASKSQLVSVKGIGEKTAVRILKYKEKLGGFSSLNQLNDVYGLDSVVKLNKERYFFVSTKELTQLNINKVTFKELLAHPYCDYNSTKKLINFREMHGDFISIEQILENNLIKAEQYRKIAPYLTLK